ncbi:predicted protein [Sclerotinia sclerotiorum 1980 UF-70]|uniref:Uncharacterized protein n=2 Tax=Sclerotinia sclerotiorum (strain ATCC 18683 / 1980 / Ss-1) TaxID=665079 RepID=A7F2Y2_SCLS1|nr:predicted protein [Sclerotinia sclerotiorum 1980 UF-70]APA09471.1 hypothetical protein sscle_05g042410 [Sclerotinia sclerotiorum 1980 UF-70]EDN96074.1 predicted protein [Sclerotinia sclerotiorum 1980 UF-70]
MLQTFWVAWEPHANTSQGILNPRPLVTKDEVKVVRDATYKQTQAFNNVPEGMRKRFASLVKCTARLETGACGQWGSSLQEA